MSEHMLPPLLPEARVRELLDDAMTELTHAIRSYDRSPDRYTLEEVAEAREKIRALASRKPGEGDATSRTPQTAREDLEKGAGAWLSDSERRLRRMLAFAYSGTRLYGDDGELQDASMRPFIDYMRDSVEQIEKAIYARGMAALSTADVPLPPSAGQAKPSPGEE